MPCFPQTLFGFDVDYLFAYPTVKIVKIQDARLGMIRYFLTFLICLYIGVIQLWKVSEDEVDVSEATNQR